MSPHLVLSLWNWEPVIKRNVFIEALKSRLVACQGPAENTNGEIHHNGF